MPKKTTKKKQSAPKRQRAPSLLKPTVKPTHRGTITEYAVSVGDRTFYVKGTAGVYEVSLEIDVIEYAVALPSETNVSLLLRQNARALLSTIDSYTRARRSMEEAIHALLST
jgi:hypothetical protein